MKRTIILLIVCITNLTGIGCSQDNTSQEAEKASLDQKIGQMLNIGFRGMAIADTNHIVRDIRQYHLGGVTLFDYDVPLDTAARNIGSLQQVKKLTQDLQSRAQTPLVIAIDQEGGKVARLKPERGFPNSVSAQYLGTLNNIDSTRYYTQKMSQSLSNLGINVNLAPVVDLNTNPQNPVIGSLERSFSADPQTVVRHATAYINMLHKFNVLSVLKHFPGHGSSKKDSHLGVVDVTETWEQKELIPYRELINSGTADMIMTAHIFNARWDSTYPATLSKAVITGMLREELGFEGVVMSDDLMMGAIREEYGLKTAINQAILAGVDVLSFANNSVYDPDIVPKAHNIIKELIEEGQISRNRIDDSYQRIMKMKSRLSTKRN
ncbi:glycoside hydrolase family 3 protein [Fodinibius salsisoli]|uniref:beta-N-acetylhexosaminidase n=1 Tax=Fodinibius salsisoli TaxID=2820877 RepID=A0ABT3PPR3_9BACT|nr:glycoside hydrolase family 3 protein [Fodinibius salsisoli]MCW9707842.1 glycoside hydrolase family 3 [Fodinibius salsisoli]